MVGEKSRALDFLRVVSCFAVVILHASAPYIYEVGSLDNADWHAANFIDSAVRWCVPVFVMMSGALNLRIQNTEFVGFYIRRFSRIVPMVLFWSLFYICYGSLAHGQPASMNEAISAMFSGRPYYHLYFLFLISGLYLVTPFFSQLICRMGINANLLLIFACMSLSFIWRIAALDQNFATWFVPYVGYYLLGSLLSGRKASNRLLVWAFLGSLCLTSIGTWVLVSCIGISSPYGLYFYSYLSPNVAIMSVCVFMFASRNMGSAPSWFSRLAPLTLGVYLVHVLFLEQIDRILLEHSMQTGLIALDILVKSVLAVAVSLSVVYLASRVPVIKKLVQ